jgi:hypothetical protein
MLDDLRPVEKVSPSVDTALQKLQDLSEIYAQYSGT